MCSRESRDELEGVRVETPDDPISTSYEYPMLPQGHTIGASCLEQRNVH